MARAISAGRQDFETMRMTEQFFSIDYAGRSDLFEGKTVLIRRGQGA